MRKVCVGILIVLLVVLMLQPNMRSGDVNGVASMDDGTLVYFEYPVKTLRDVHPSLKQHSCCEEWVKVQASIREAEWFMTNHQMHLIFPGDWSAEFKADYDYHKKWIVVRDKIHLAKGYD